MTKKYKNNEHNLPIPRLQIRNEIKNGMVHVTYSLIHNNINGTKETIFHKSTLTLTETTEKMSEHEIKPHTTFAHLLYDIWQLKLPAYIVSKNGFSRVSLNDEVQKITFKQWEMMKNDTEREEDFLQLQRELNNRMCK